MDPHSTQKGSRACRDCHQDPRSVGLGRGTLTLKPEGWAFTPALAKIQTTLALDHPLDAYVDINGNPLVHTSRTTLRPFNADEIRRILYVGLCLSCHEDFSDPVMLNWRPGNAPLPCPRAKELFQSLTGANHGSARPVVDLDQSVK